jgi:hypothetical protein
MHTVFMGKVGMPLVKTEEDEMAAPEQQFPKKNSFVIQCSPENFEHAAWLSAVYSEVLSVNEQTHSLRISPLPDMLKGQFEKLGASVSTSPSFL